MEETSALLNCECSQLLLFEGASKEKLKTKVAHKLPLREFSVKENDVIGSVCRTGELANIQDFTRTRFYDPRKHEKYLGQDVQVLFSVVFALLLFCSFLFCLCTCSIDEALFSDCWTGAVHSLSALVDCWTAAVDIHENLGRSLAGDPGTCEFIV